MFPCCDLAPLETLNHVHMYTFPATMQQKPAPFMPRSGSQAHSLHPSTVGRWHLGFWLTYRFAYRYRFSPPRAPSPSRERVAHHGKRSLSVFAGLTTTVNYRRGVKGKSDPEKRLCSGDTHGLLLVPLFPLLPCFRNKGSPGLLQPDS